MELVLFNSCKFILDVSMDANIHQNLNTCNEVMKNDSYKTFVDGVLSSWYKFIPVSREKHILPSNCWYTNSFKHVPQTVIDRIQSVSNFNHISHQFQQSEAEQILEAVLKDNQTAKFEVIRSKKQKPSGEIFCLPTVYLPGFPKCGTTTLYNLLMSHPHIERPARKEGQFWGNFMIAPNKAYQDLQPLLYIYRFKEVAKKIARSNHKLTIDGSTHTVYDSSRLGDAVSDMCMIPILLHKVMPDTKIIIMLRNPTSRLWSHYWFYCSRTKYDFEKYDGLLPPVPDHVINKASERFHNHTVAAINEFNNCIQSGNSEFKCTYDAFYDDDHHSLACGKSRIGVSLYYIHIMKWLSVFPREQLLFLTMEELAEDSYAIVSKAWKFVGLEPIPRSSVPPIVSNTNKWIISNKYKDKFKMWPETKELLDTFFHPFNQRLAKLLDNERFLWTERSQV